MIGYKSWAIPEGNVVQVTDESGAVIWSSGPKVSYLRPSADVAITASTYPAGISAYTCINEEVADGDSTYIYNQGAVSTFVFSGVVLNKKIESVRFVTISRTTDGKNSTSKVEMVFNGITFVVPTYSSMTDSYVETGGSIMNGVYKEGAYGGYYEAGDDATAIVTALNEYVEVNGGGDISFEVSMQLVFAGKNAEARTTQAYIEITYK